MRDNKTGESQESWGFHCMSSPERIRHCLTAHAQIRPGDSLPYLGPLPKPPADRPLKCVHCRGRSYRQRTIDVRVGKNIEAVHEGCYEAYLNTNR